MNTIAARLIFQNSVKAVQKAFRKEIAEKKVDIRQFKLTQSYLRLETLCVAAQNSFTFNILQSNQQGTQFSSENRLTLQDSFVISEVGFFLGFPATSAITDTAFPLITYPNPAVIGANTDPYFTAYAGQMTITVNRNVLLPSWDLQRHYYAPETQQTAALGAGSPRDENRGLCDGFYPMEPNIVAIGSKNTQIQLLLPNPGMTAIATNSRFILILRGVLAQNSTVVS